MFSPATLDEIIKANLRRLIATLYPNIHGLDKDTMTMIIEQLMWVQHNKQFTPQSDVFYQEGGEWQKHLHREIFRALSRIECMLLLYRASHEGDLDALYERFTQDQPKEDKLSKESFEKLSLLFKDFTPAQIEAQVRASLIAAVTLSPKAQEEAKSKLGAAGYPYDSVMFSGRTISKCPEIYPAYTSAAPEVQTLLQYAFPDDHRHFRHAFFLENAGCLDPLKTAKTSPQAQIMLQEWLNYWLVNALGFDGHVGNLVGSRFLTESVFLRIVILNNAIQELLTNPVHDVLAAYSQNCLLLLKVQADNPKIATFVFRIVNMANVFNPQAADFLTKRIMEEKSFQTYIEKHDHVFKSGKVATYLPGFLQNVYAAVSGNQETKLMALLEAMHWASECIEKSTAPITSFRLLDKNKVQDLIRAEFHSSFEIDDKGEIRLSAPAAVAAPAH